MTRPINLYRPLILAIDPGKVCGLALVERPLSGQRPVLLGAWVVTASRRGLWLSRCRESIAVARQLAGGRPWDVACEQSPPTRRRTAQGRGVGGDVAGIRTAEGMGRYGGQAIALAWSVGESPETDPLVVDQQVWTAGLRVSPAKKGDGSHRISEAAAYLSGDDPLWDLPVDAAEAALIGAAVALGVCR